MSERVHLVIDGADKARYQEVAAREGKSLSVWLREAAEQRYLAAQGTRALATPAHLDAFFAECDARETGTEPDWSVHKKVIEESMSHGLPAARPARKGGRR
jgi:hypothetical protein